jgi:WD40 repeat protein
MRLGNHTSTRGARAACALALLLVVPATAVPAEKAAAKGASKGPKVTYDDNVRTIFRERCFACHNTEKKTAGLDLSTYTGVMTGGGSGAVIEAGSSGDSYLFSLVSHTSEPHMPPKSEKLPADYLATIAKWIDGGALESKGSKAAASKKPKLDFALKGAPVGRPEGPPPMPERLSIEPVVRATRPTAQRTVATSPWSPLAAIPGQKQVLLYNTKTLELVGVLPFPEGIPEVLKFSRNGLLLLAGGGRGAASGRVVVWNVKTGERMFEVGDELDAVLGADISADQSLIALGGPGKIVRVYSTADGSLKSQMKKHTDWIYSVAFSPDGVLLATADRNGGIVIWEAATGREYSVLAGHASAVTALSWRIDSNILASASEDASIKLWEMENGTQVKTWNGHGGGVTSINFTRDGRLVSCGRDGVARLWDQNGAAKTGYSGFADVPLSVAYCDETNRLIAGDWTGAFRVFDAASGKQIGSLDANPPRLAERLDAAAHELAQRKAEHQQVADRLAAVQAESLKHRAELEAAQKSAAAAMTSLKAATDAAAKAKTVVDSLSAEIETATKVAASLPAVLPILKEAADKSAQAAAKLPGDKEVAAAADLVKSQYAKKQAQLDDAKRGQADRNVRLKKAKPELAAAEKHAAELKSAYETARQRAIDPVVVAKRALDSSAQTLAQAEQHVLRWKDEIAFQAKIVAFVALQTKTAQLAEAVQTAQTAYDAGNGEVAKLQARVAAAQKESEAAAAGVKRAQDLVVQLTAERAANLRQAGALDALLPALSETLAKAEEASRRVPGDADVTTQVTEIKSLISKKTTELELAKKSAAEKPKAIETARNQIPLAEKKFAESKTAIEAAEKTVVDATVSLRPLADKLAAAKSAQTEGSKTVEAAKKELDSLKPHRAA